MALAPGPEAAAAIEGAAPLSTGPAPREGKSPTRIAFERLRRDKVAVLCFAVIMFFVLLGLLAPLLVKLVGVDIEPHQDPDTIDFNTGLGVSQSWPAHPLGVEAGTGRDLFYQWVYGARPSLIIGLLASVLTVLVGVTMGLLAGYLGGWFDRVVSWLTDFVLALPFLLIAIGTVPIVLDRFGDADSQNYIEPGREAGIRFAALVAILVLFQWPTIARLVRGEVLSLREREFVQAARSLGMSPARIVFKEVLPNLLNVILVNFTILIPAFISAEAGLSFLGVGLKEPMFSWGQTIQAGVRYADAYPIWMWVPALSVALLVLALSLFGDAVADAFNPQTRR